MDVVCAASFYPSLFSFQNAEPSVAFEGSQLDIPVVFDILFPQLRFQLLFRDHFLAQILRNQSSIANERETWRRQIWIGSHSAVQTKAIGSAQVADKVVKVDARKLGKPLFCVPGLGRLDDCVALVVADVLKREGFNARVSGVDTEIDNADTICVCFVEEVSAGKAAFMRRKFARRAAAANIIICQLGRVDEKGSFEEVDGAAPQSLEEIFGEVSKSVGLRDRKEQ